MSEKKFTKEGNARVAEVSDTIRDNTLNTVNEIAKVQPQIAQSVSNLQQDTIETSKNMIKTVFDTQKQIASGLNVSMPSQVSEQVVKHSNEIASAFTRATGVYNQLVIDTLDMAQENVRICGKAVDAVTEYNTNILNSWVSFWTAQQRQFLRE
jgi:hypothetical protein